MGLTDRVIKRIFEVEPIRAARDESVRTALQGYESMVQEAWERNKGIYEAKINRAYEAGFFDGNDDPAAGDLKKGGRGYRRISDNYIREGAIDYQKALSTAWQLWQKSPLAKRVLTLKRDHIFGHGSIPSAENTKASDISRQFWMDNKLDKRANQFVIQLFGMGEQCFPAAVRKADGRVRIGYIDPRSIVEVVKHPDNSLEDWAVVVERVGEKGAVEKVVYRIIRDDEDYADDNTVTEAKYRGKLVTWEQATREPWEDEMVKRKGGRDEYYGSCFFYKVNAASNQPRGMSDLLQVADWIDQGEEVLFALADRERMANYFVWLVKLIGYTPEQVRERANDVRSRPPKPGSIYFHNENEEPALVSPDLGQGGTIETFRTILGFILGGVGFPVYSYGFGDDTNLATGTVQAEPFAKSLEYDQGTIKNMFLNMCQFAIDQRSIVDKNIGLDNEEYELTLALPEVTTKDMSRVASSLVSVAQAVTNAQQQGWNSEETAVKVWAKMLSEFDIDIDVKAELKAVKDEMEKRELDEERKNNNGLNGLLNGKRPLGGNGANGMTAGDFVDALKER